MPTSNEKVMLQQSHDALAQLGKSIRETAEEAQVSALDSDSKQIIMANMKRFSEKLEITLDTLKRVVEAAERSSSGAVLENENFDSASTFAKEVSEALSKELSKAVRKALSDRTNKGKRVQEAEDTVKEIKPASAPGLHISGSVDVTCTVRFSSPIGIHKDWCLEGQAIHKLSWGGDSSISGLPTRTP